MERRPLIIVGSGPAGTATAIALHRRDPGLARDILILEKARHPRPKVCAGGLIPAGRQWMAEHDVPLCVPHVTVHRAQVVTPTRTVGHDDDNLCYVIRRNELDAALADAVRERGIEIREEEPVQALERDDDGIRVAGRRDTWRTPLLIGADGAGSLVRRRLVDDGRTRIARAIMADVPIDRTRWDGFARDRYDFDFRILRRGLRGYLWAFPCLIDGVPHANIGAYAVTPSGAALDEALSNYLAELGAGEPRRVAFPIHWYQPGARIAADGAWLVGDAAGVDPLMGEGISLAMEYGDLAAAAIVDAVRRREASAQAYQRAFDASWLGAKLRRLHMATRLFYGPTWRLAFAAAERSRRLRALGLRWYNGVDGWDRRSGWEAVAAVLTNRVGC
ncbi:MAG TPA: NAD(P)/FAD-dependent oxidoreductase [Candidatus Dormibacteraeota bacterium]|nr:NAD(P)/FAD-dependent oxidoreductase [Candidatus Dormibacteraeota bacterium]